MWQYIRSLGHFSFPGSQGLLCCSLNTSRNRAYDIVNFSNNELYLYIVGSDCNEVQTFPLSQV